LICGAAIGISAIVAVSCISVAASRDQGIEILNEPTRMRAWIQEYGRTVNGLFMMLLPTQIVFLLLSLAAATLSPRPFVKRLKLGSGVLPLWTWLVFVIGTPIVGIISSELLSLFVTELSDNLKMIESVMRFHARSALPSLILLVAVTPGVIEELMFRGYLQSRLTERMPAALGILISALIFSIAHLDLLHVVGVLPLGLWLGAIAWRADSVWPAILCHAMNNTIAVLSLQFQPESSIGVEMGPVTVGTLIVCAPAFLFSLYIIKSR
jgi:membrane protease YdiL (CAAX protease family)